MTSGKIIISPKCQISEATGKNTEKKAQHLVQRKFSQSKAKVGKACVLKMLKALMFTKNKSMAFSLIHCPYLCLKYSFPLGKLHTITSLFIKIIIIMIGHLLLQLISLFL